MGPHLTTLVRESLSQAEATTGDAREELSTLLGEARDYVRAEVERVRNDTNARVSRLFQRNDEFRDCQRDISARVAELREAYLLIQQKIASLEQQMIQDPLMTGVETVILEPTQGSDCGMEQPLIENKVYASGPPKGHYRIQCRCCGKPLAKNYVRTHEKMHCPILKQLNHPVPSTVTGSSRVTSPVDYL